MTQVDVVVHPDPEVVAHAVAARLLVRLLDAQAARGVASIVLTGGRVAAAVYESVADSPARRAVDWSRVDVWWGDERFLPRGHPDRNETQARAALLDRLPLDPSRLHPMPSSDGPAGDDPEAAAVACAADLATAAGAADLATAAGAADLATAARQGSEQLPRFDLLLLGVGEEGHVASVFPGAPAVYEHGPVVAVRGCPKPPPTRISLTIPAINTAEEVWLMATGTEKATAVGMALSGADPVRVPAAGVHGVERTVWLLDRAAAAQPAPYRLSPPE